MNPVPSVNKCSTLGVIETKLTGNLERMRDAIPKYLSKPRFGRYLKDCNGDFDEALALYEANVKLSGAAMEAINTVEVTLRNSMDAQLRQWNMDRINNEGWTLLPAAHLANVARIDDNLDKAKKRAASALGKKREPNHDDIVAQLSFGTWFYLMPSAKRDSKTVIWDSVLKDAFPARHNVPVESIKESIRIVYDLRNRVAHFEPVYALNLEGKRSAMTKVLHVINRPIKRWFMASERFGNEIEKFRERWPELTPTKR